MIRKFVIFCVLQLFGSARCQTNASEDTRHLYYQNIYCASDYVCERYHYLYNTGQILCCDMVCSVDCGFDWVIFTISIISVIFGILCCVGIIALFYYSARGYYERRARRRALYQRNLEYQTGVCHDHVPSSPPAPRYSPGFRVSQAADNPNHAGIPNSPPPEYPHSAVPPAEETTRPEQALAPENMPDHSKTPTPTNASDGAVGSERRRDQSSS